MGLRLSVENLGQSIAVEGQSKQTLLAGSYVKSTSYWVARLSLSK